AGDGFALCDPIGLRGTGDPGGGAGGKTGPSLDGSGGRRGGSLPALCRLNRCGGREEPLEQGAAGVGKRTAAGGSQVPEPQFPGQSAGGSGSQGKGQAGRIAGEGKSFEREIGPFQRCQVILVAEGVTVHDDLRRSTGVSAGPPESLL